MEQNMSDQNMSSLTKKFQDALVRSIENAFAEPEFDFDEGQVRIIETTENQIRFGLYAFNEDGDPSNKIIAECVVQVNQVDRTLYQPA